MSRRVLDLPPYLFADLDRLKQAAIQKGVDVISLGIGDPDLPTPAPVVEALARAARKPENHRYPSYEGLLSFRTAAAKWCGRRFGIAVNSETEVVSLIGSKEGIAHAPLAFLNPGDAALVPDPGYPVYRTSVLFAGGRPVTLPLLEKNGFKPDLGSLSRKLPARCRMMFVNYPNNPTGAGATLDFFQELADFARRRGIIVCHDAAYTEVHFGEDSQHPPSFLQAEGAGEIGIEFHSLSKTCNMTGWRIGFAIGNRDLVGALGKIKTNIDSGVFQAIQEAGIAAFQIAGEHVRMMSGIYAERLAVVQDGLRSAGIEFCRTDGTFYVWAKVPKGHTSMEFAKKVLDRTGVVVTPGHGFGQFGEGYFRITITQDVARLQEAMSRLKALR
ncbi:MAG: LL-diaminopimelate aminotransferase [Nitrospirae bacterium]|nr:LL-diaminopimelate aminotransferase [Nitrospirota bacterium]